MFRTKRERERQRERERERDNVLIPTLKYRFEIKPEKRGCFESKTKNNVVLRSEPKKRNVSRKMSKNSWTKRIFFNIAGNEIPEIGNLCTI